LRANIHIFFEVFFPNNLAAVLTLHPQALGADRLLARGLQLTGLPLEPSHRGLSNFVIRNWVILKARKPSITQLQITQLCDQYSIPLCAMTPFAYAFFTWRIYVTVSAISTIVGWALRPVKITCTMFGFFFKLSVTFAGSSMP